jgi:hypothetical protein
MHVSPAKHEQLPSNLDIDSEIFIITRLSSVGPQAQKRFCGTGFTTEFSENAEKRSLSVSRQGKPISNDELLNWGSIYNTHLNTG